MFVTESQLKSAVRRTSLIVWLARHGCNIKFMSFFQRPYLRKIVWTPELKECRNLKELTNYLLSFRIDWIHDYDFNIFYYSCCHENDWNSAKSISNNSYRLEPGHFHPQYTNNVLDNIPF